MAQLKDTIVNGSLTVADAAAITGPTQISSGDLTLYTASTGNSPALVFQRGALNDNYNDWQIQDRGGILYFDQRGISSTAFSKVLGFGTDSSIQFTSNGYTGSLKAGGLSASRTWTLPDATGTIALASQIPTVPSNIVNTITTSEGSYTALTNATGNVTIKLPTKTSHLTNDSGFITDPGVTSITTTEGAHIAITNATGNVSFKVPTKTSHLTNDGDGTSAFARMSDIGSLGGGTITKVKTTAGAHTVIDVSSGDAEFNVPTNTSHLTNDSGFITSASIPQPLIGTTSTITPTEVLTALQAGRDVYITYSHELYGTIAATYFDYSNAFSVIISNVITAYYDDEQTTYMLFQLSGYLNNNTWGCHVTTLAEKTDIPTSAYANTTGITATTTANTTTVGSHSTDYGVKSAGSGSFTSGAFFGGSFTQGTDSFTTNTPTVIDTTKFNGGSYSHTGFNGGSGSFTQGSFNGGSGSFSATVDNHVLSFSHTHTAATHGADSHTHTAATYGTDSFTAASLSSGFYSAGTAASFTQGNDTFSPATHGADSHTHTAPTLGSKVPTVSTTSATVSITDPGHTHSLST